MTVAETLELVEGLAKIQQTYRIDALEASGVRLARSIHDLPESPRNGNHATADDDDELVDWSAPNGGG